MTRDLAVFTAVSEAIASSAERRLGARRRIGETAICSRCDVRPASANSPSRMCDKCYAQVRQIARECNEALFS